MAGNLHHNSGIKPPRLENCKTFSTFKKAVDLWRQVSGIPAEQQGIVVALSLPASCIFGENLGNKAIESIPSSKLNSPEGLDLVLGFLDKELVSDSSSEIIKRWNDFFYLSRDEGQSVDEYIEKFETSVEHLKEAGQELADQVKGVELMRKLGLKSNERKKVQELVDFNKNKDKVYEAMKEQTKLFLQKSNGGHNTKAVNDGARVGADFVKVPPPSLFPNGPKAFGVPVTEGYFVGPRPPPAQNLRQNTVPSNWGKTGPCTFTNLGPSTFHAQGGRGRNGAPQRQRNNQGNGPTGNKNNNNNNKNNSTAGANGGKKPRGKSVAPAQNSGGKGAGGSDQTQTIIVHVNSVSK